MADEYKHYLKQEQDARTALLTAKAEMLNALRILLLKEYAGYPVVFYFLIWLLALVTIEAGVRIYLELS